ncbi:hypothetical protein Droror1_Dr00026656, partial [Drosera rotundifolia]
MTSYQQDPTWSLEFLLDDSNKGLPSCSTLFLKISNGQSQGDLVFVERGRAAAEKFSGGGGGDRVGGDEKRNLKEEEGERRREIRERRRETLVKQHAQIVVFSPPFPKSRFRRRSQRLLLLYPPSPPLSRLSPVPISGHPIFVSAQLISGLLKLIASSSSVFLKLLHLC